MTDRQATKTTAKPNSTAASAATSKIKTAGQKSETTAKITAVKKTVASRTADAQPKGKKAPVKSTSATVTKKAPAPKTSAKAALRKAVKVPPIKDVTANPKPVVSTIEARPAAEERYRMVEMAAYFIAERNGFIGESTAHWAAAEKEIADKLGQ